MSSHDEYSSDEEDIIDEKQISQVYLGFVDAPILSGEEENDEPTIEDTFIGGNPVWLHPNSQPTDSQIKCDSCGGKMALLSQIFAPFEGKSYDRVLYIFGCPKTSQCSNKKGSVKCLRGISKDPVKMAQIEEETAEAARKELDEKLRLDNTKKLQIELTKDLFSNSGKDTEEKSDNPFVSSANPFGAASNPFDATSNPFNQSKNNDTDNTKSHPNSLNKESFAEAAAKNLPKSLPKKALSAVGQLPSYPGYFVYVEQEKFKKITIEPELEKYKHLVDLDDETESASRADKKQSSSSSHMNPQTAKISNMLDDKYFEAFTNTVKHNNSQVLRYDLGGKPLLYSGQDDIAAKFNGRDTNFNIPNPGYNPSSTRQFECQLMPKAILDLENENNKTASLTDILNGMSWGTIIVCTDVEDYMPADAFDENNVAYIEEWCGVQWEESV
ncbi:uncharacterized protein AC631_04056 [Debaryomyces fabryi]|uniref:Programmed cell death protein 2 C-terminal domain-containing protein n=1 Tax=Debaryomyces fabryi TaxID=58627 RepID=A0A0V1PVG4_9ASCO|nr:uncharacterized protein AC631_04056 [Debaryomyces fabryi]KSA00176.1 hypothetical protein AC631_04056 [Debaryomyces fabryi]CUM52163.1 unnamed protein product [Debaryomyces fabryi]